MNLLKKIFYSFIFVLILFSLNTKYVQASDGLDFESITSATCGYANTENNQCCGKSTNYNIEEKDLNSAIEKIKSCKVTHLNKDNLLDLTSCNFTDKEASIITSLIYTEKDDNIKLGVGLCLRDYFLSQSETKKNDFFCDLPGPLGSMGIGQIEDFFRSKRTEYNNLSDSEKLALQTKNNITDDKCLINLLGGHTLCVQGSIDYALRQIGKDPKIGAVINTQNELAIDTCVTGEPKEEAGACTCTAKTGLSILCNKYIKNPAEYNQCATCTESRGGLWTGFGCIGLSFQGFIQETLFGWALGLAGIITLLCIIYAAFMLQMSAGNPERIKKARQYLTACITGLLLIVFSILILRIIGVDILKIPGFN